MLLSMVFLYFFQAVVMDRINAVMDINVAVTYSTDYAHVSKL